MSLQVEVDVVMTNHVSSDITMSPDSKIANLLEKVIAEQPRYIGIYAPGDFHIDNYRIVIPDAKAVKPGRGFRGLREEVLIELGERGGVDRVVERLQELVGTPSGPKAIRHMLNPSTSKDEGLRLIWSRDGQLGEMEMADWPRRDKMIREGKTVVEVEGVPDVGLGHEMNGFWGFQPWVGMAMDVDVSNNMPLGMDMGMGMGMGNVNPYGFWAPVATPMTIDE